MKLISILISNFDEDDPKTVIHARRVAFRNKSEKGKANKKI